ncbi:hypothetical protein ACHAW5_003087 [Stephanodiscus triporus]|uniref:Rab3 GTPase-activating protein catalytic subunit n=1 Tax=Stephanodiscus triporus TaxID=2934178 RepID=A0ABD3MC02_9STRA
MDRCVRTGEGMESDRESEKNMNKDRLTAYYRIYNPELLNSVDKILKIFEGRNEVLNEKLKRKYGKGFLPDDELKDRTRNVRKGGHASSISHVNVFSNSSNDDSDPYNASAVDSVSNNNSSASSSSMLSTSSSLSLSRRRSMGSKLGSKLKNRPIFSKINYSSSSPDDEEKSNEQDTSNDSGYQNFLSLINEATADTNNHPGATLKGGICDDKDGDGDGDEGKSCHEECQLESLDDGKLLPAQQTFRPLHMPSQPLAAELSSEEEDCTPPATVDEGSLKELTETTTDKNNNPGVTHKGEQCDQKFGDKDEGQSCHGEHQLELLDDEELLQAHQPFPPSRILPQLLAAELQSEEECKNDQESRKEQQQLVFLNDELQEPQSRPFTTSHLLPQSLGTNASSEDECTPPTSISGNELMGRFSSVALGPSPVKLKGDHSFMNIDMSMDSLNDVHHEQHEDKLDHDVGTDHDDGMLTPNRPLISGTQRPHWCSLAQIPVVSIAGAECIRVGGGQNVVVSPSPTSNFEQQMHDQKLLVSSTDPVYTSTLGMNSSSSSRHPDISTKQSPWPSAPLCEAAPSSERSIESDTRQLIVSSIHSETLDEKSSSLHLPSLSTSPPESNPPATHPATVSAMDCISQYSSLKSPSPMKMSHFAFDESMDTSIGMNDSVLDDINICDVDPCDDYAMDDNADECVEYPSNHAPTFGDDSDSQEKEPSHPCRSPRESYDNVSTKKMKFKHLSSTKLSRRRSQTSNISGLTSPLHREYNVDHSCSTPLERLARDVGNTLRQWRVHQGCDWHVSLDWAEKMEDAEKELVEKDSDFEDEVSDNGEGEISCLDMSIDVDPQIKCMSMDICERGFANRIRIINSWMGDENAILPSSDNFLLKKPQSQSPPPSSEPRPRVPFTQRKESSPAQTGRKVNTGSCHRGAQCIRSQKIQFHTMGYSPEQIADSVDWNRRQYTIPLLLKLWDAPYFPAQACGDRFVGTDFNGCDGTDHTVPRSLQHGISSSSFSLTGELGILSPCGTGRLFYNPSSTTPSTNITDEGTFSGLTRDISSLFNIGQHITLCLDLSENMNDAGHEGIESIYNDIRFCIENNITEAFEAQRHALQERRRRWMQRHHQLLKRKHTRLEDTRRQKQVDNSDDNRATLNDDAFDRDDGSEYDIFESEDSDGYYTLENDLHLNPQDIHAEVTASLTALLQTALNLAASENDCSIPVFGIWGDYCGDSGENDKRRSQNDKASPSWISSGLECDLLQIRDSFIVGQGENDDESSTELLLSSPALSGICLSGKFQSTHRLYYVPTQVLPLHLSTLNGLAKILLTQCPSIDGTVVLSAARHRYHWEQRNDSPPNSTRSQEWRTVGSASADNDTSPVEMYREQCQHQALRLLERASSQLIYRPEPMWGPNEGNPLVSLSVIVTWGVIPVQEDTPTNPPSLLQLPLKIRSSNFASTPSELLDVEYALQSAALNPIGMGIVEKEGGHHEFGPREPVFLACAEFDIDAPCATLSANTRCVLAALLRCGSLGLDTLPGHLTRRKIVDNFSRQATIRVAGESTWGEDLSNAEKVLRESLSLAKVGPVTKRLIDALDWGDIKMDLSAADFDRAANEALQRTQSTTYPAPPAEVFSIGAGNGKSHAANHKLQSQSKGSPPGRLLSILFAHMARLRTPPSMMRLWLSFVEELRTRWDNNESLPNLGFVPGLDSNDDAGMFHWGLQKVNTRVLGHRADHAAFVNSSEPDPDRDHCIINQMLQRRFIESVDPTPKVFNICIECKMSIEALHNKRNITQDDEINDAMESGGTVSENQSIEEDDEFFDPEDEEVSFVRSPDAKQESRDIERMLMLQAAVMTPSHNRVGARCPVPDAMPLIQSGDQLYAPYLQRTMPMTDEEEQKQKKIMGFGEYTEQRLSIKSRIAIAQRLQKPKLLSDMSSFKAANHGAVFEDFVRWYGYPENPLNEEVNGETARRAIERRSKLPPEEAKTLALEEASEAINILMSLRAFWEDTWEEAEPCPAFDQEPLFNPNSTVEMVLHSFETMHPAILLNQVLSVTLTNVKFVLLERAAGPARNVRSVALGLANLHVAIDVALEMLTKDAADALHLSPEKLTDNSGPLVHVSTLTIKKCEETCNLIGELEMLLSRALPLLQVLPGEYDLVESLLQCKDGEFCFLKNPSQRSALLQAIKHQQICSSNSTPEAIPVMREYVLRNLDPYNPCQLSARLVPNLKEAQSASLFHGSLLMALTKSCA